MAVYKTVQRRLLLEHLGAHKGEMFTVRAITAAINDAHKENAPSESTVYRLMRELVEDGTVRKTVDPVSRENVYFIPAAENAGVSMRCRVCGNVYNVDDVSGRRIKDELTRLGDAVPDDSIELLIKCRKCK